MADSPQFDAELAALLQAVYARYQYDFRDYAIASLRRRVRQAMGHFRSPTVPALQERLVRDADAFGEALQFFTVQVSEMFRDPGYFRALREEVLPVLATYPSLKIWVAGCSRGEEVWSLAILLHEEGLLERALIYATDINAQALRQAEDGIYTPAQMQQFSANYLQAGGKGSLSDYYTSAYNGAILDRGLRRNMVFADHSLATDSVFSEVHLVSCRNVLIYFNRELQDRAVGLFRDALVPRGYLGIGPRESLQFSSAGTSFEPVVHAQRIYRKRP